MPFNTGVRVTPDGIPYVVEFANVSIWPRPPMVHTDGDCRSSEDLAQKPSLSRSNTLPATTAHKALPSIPLPVRSRSLKLFRNKVSSTHVKTNPVADALDISRPVIRRDASFTADVRNSAHRHFKIFNDDFSASEETLVEFEASVTLTPPMPEAPSEDGLSLRTGGLYIQFPTSPTVPEIPSEVPLPPSIEPEIEGMSQVDFEKTTRLRLHRLSRAISKAVLAAGMEAPPRPTKFDAEESVDSKPGDPRLVRSRQGLFKGTYGQVRSAFRAAGLVTTPCGEDGLPNGMLSSVTCHTYLIGVLWFSHASWCTVYRESRRPGRYRIHQGRHVGLIDDRGNILSKSPPDLHFQLAPCAPTLETCLEQTCPRGADEC
jgi:hypothetical protein